MEKPAKNYIVIKSCDRYGLEEDVNDKIEMGYKPYGELIVKTTKETGNNNWRYFQAMMLEKKLHFINE